MITAAKRLGLYSAFRACRAIVLRSSLADRLTVATMFCRVGTELRLTLVKQKKITSDKLTDTRGRVLSIGRGCGRSDTICVVILLGGRRCQLAAGIGIGEGARCNEGLCLRGSRRVTGQGVHGGESEEGILDVTGSDVLDSLHESAQEWMTRAGVDRNRDCEVGRCLSRTEDGRWIAGLENGFGFFDRTGWWERSY
jgi:hypothetical protein